MNAKAVIAALEGLQGHHILVLTSAVPTGRQEGHGFVHGQPCIRVEHLPPDQRHQPDQGNIILWDGRFTPQWLQAGGTFWAKDIHSIHWVYNPIIHIYTHNDTRISIIKLWRLT